jgi:hypothetical protein
MPATRTQPYRAARATYPLNQAANSRRARDRQAEEAGKQVAKVVGEQEGEELVGVEVTAAVEHGALAEAGE